MLQTDIQHFVTRFEGPPGLCRCASLLVCCVEFVHYCFIQNREFPLQLWRTTMELA